MTSNVLSNLGRYAGGVYTSTKCSNNTFTHSLLLLVGRSGWTWMGCGAAHDKYACG